MGDLLPFGYKGLPDTCLWCGQKLRFGTVLDSKKEAELVAAGVSHREAFQQALVRADKPGGYHDGFFHSLRCAYQFAVRMAGLGERLELKDGA